MKKKIKYNIKEELIIEVNSIHVNEKDHVELKTIHGFKKIKISLFPNSPIFMLNEVYYLLADEVMYSYNTKN